MIFQLNSFIGIVCDKLDDSSINLLIAEDVRTIPPKNSSNKILASCKDALKLNVGDLLIIWIANSTLNNAVIIDNYTCIGSVELEKKKEEAPKEPIAKTQYKFMYTEFNPSMITDPACFPANIPPIL
mgnify:CR=1 FL=1